MARSTSLHLVSLDVPDAGPWRVGIVAGGPLVRAGLAALLAGIDGWHAAPLADDLPPDLIAWDAGTASEGDLAAAGPEGTAPIVALIPDADALASVWAAGARAILLRDTTPELLAVTLAAAWNGLVVLDPALADAAIALPDPDLDVDLTPRETEVLALLAEGLPNKLIADALGISEHTAKYHIASILGKLGAHSRTEAVIRAARQGLLLL